MKSAHSQRLETWLGADTVANLSRTMRGFHGTQPIAIAGVPGEVYATNDGDFIGRCDAGQEADARQRARDLGRLARSQLNSGFASLAALKDALRYKGTRQDFVFNLPLQGATKAIGAGFSYWCMATQLIPPVGTIGSAAPGGRVPVGGTDGGFRFTDAPAGKTTHFAGGSVINKNAAAAQSGLCIADNLLLYDRIFDVAKTMNSTATEAVTGVPTRYQNTTLSAADSINGNFCFVETQTAIGATAHNWTTCTYKDQANAASTFPSTAGISGCSQGRLDLPLYSWHLPLEAGDTGIKALTQMQCSAAVASGTQSFVIGHPIAFMPTLASAICDVGGISTALNLARIFDGACLSLLIPCASVINQNGWDGYFTTVAG